MKASAHGRRLRAGDWRLNLRPVSQLRGSLSPSLRPNRNVPGLLKTKIGARQLSSGMVKFILRALTSMGYQTRLGLLQSGQFGVPQSRRRVFFWGAKCDAPLPPFPLATHAFPTRGSPLTFAFDGQRHRLAAQNRTAGAAPHGPVAIRDAIKDLPEFEWLDPHKRYAETTCEAYERIKRKKMMPAYSAVKSADNKVVGELVQAYATEPLTTFQRTVREGSQVVIQHQTRTFPARMVEAVVNIPMRRGANHWNLHSLSVNKPILRPWCFHS